MTNPQEQSLLLRIGGAQGHGIDSASLLFSRASAKMGFHILSRRDYHSNIMGRHSFSDIRIASWPIAGHVAISDILVCFDAESLCRHFETVVDKGIILLDEDDADVDSHSLKYLDAEIKTDLINRLNKDELSFNVSDLFSLIKKKDITLILVPFSDFRRLLQTELSISRSEALRSKNIFFVALSAALLNMPASHLINEVERLFANKEPAIILNRKAIELAYKYVESLNINPQQYLPVADKVKQDYLWLNGCKSIALGKIVAGMGMQPYYPISPATDESSFLESVQNSSLNSKAGTGHVVVQTEDELAAITMACGAALTGARVSTSTSGPGFSLMAEGLGWAGMNEVPVVVTLYQRGGPSTGLPTRTEQGDLLFAINAGHGEFPRIVVASADVNECFYDAFRAFNYAERYQMPVIHIVDKNLASTSQNIIPFDTSELVIERGVLADKDNKHIARFKITSSGISPRPFLGEQEKTFWSSGTEHSEFGQVSENPGHRKLMMEKRANKLELALADIPEKEKLSVYGDDKASFTIISWGSNKGVIVDALKQFKAEGKSVRAIMVKLLWPFPVDELNKLIHQQDTVIIIECNQSGQFNRLLKEQTGRNSDYQILKYTGRPFMLEDILYHLNNIISNKAEKLILVE